jgi:general secretion pathway protein K
MTSHRSTISCRVLHQDGFALVAVIWAIGLISLLFVTYIAAARYRAIEAFSMSQRARMEALANAAVNRAIFEIMAGMPKGEPSTRRFGEVGVPLLCGMHDGTVVSVSVWNESGKVDLNTAQPELIDALVKSAANAEGDYRAIALSILRMRQPTASAEAGASSGGPAPPRFRSVMELGRVAGVGSEMANSLLPLVTVNSGSPGVNPRVASDDVLRAISGGNARVSRAQMERSASAFLLADAPGRAFMIAGEAAAASGARFSRDAIVEFAPGPPLTYSIREWRQGPTRLGSGVNGAILPPC